MNDTAGATPRLWARGLASIRAADPHLIRLVLLFVAVKAALLAIALLGHQLLPFNWETYRNNLVVDLGSLHERWRPFNTWDTQHYLYLSRVGYGSNPMSDAFYPVYPYLIWVFTPLFLGRGLSAAYCIANVASLLVPIYMYKLGCLFHTKEQAFWGAVALLSFPTAFYLSVAYAESIYLPLCLMAFYYLFKREFGKASLFCFLVPLSRAQGLLVLLPIGVLILHELAGERRADWRARLARSRPMLAPAAAMAMGVLVYLAMCRWQLGGFFEGLRAQRLYVGDNSLGKLLEPLAWLRSNFLDADLEIHGYTNSLLDRVAFLLCLPLLALVYRTEHKALFAYAAVTLLVPALAGSFMSYTRVLLAVFPLFLGLGTARARIVYLAIVGFALQILFYLMHTGGYWVA